MILLGEVDGAQLLEEGGAPDRNGAVPAASPIGGLTVRALPPFAGAPTSLAASPTSSNPAFSRLAMAIGAGLLVVVLLYLARKG